MKSKNSSIPKTKNKKRSPGYSRNKGNAYERKIVKELKELGFDVSTTRLVSKSEDANKVDIHDNRGDLPCKIQVKATQQIPPYFKIRSESTVDPDEFTIIWSKQEKKETNIVSVGEVVMIPKRLFYKLIKPYANKSNV